MKKRNIFWGIFFIVAAACMLLGGMGYFEGVGLLSIFLTVLVGAVLVKSIMHLEVTGILFSLAFLAIIYARQLGITAITPWPVLGAALLGSIGCSFLFRPWRRKSYHRDYDTVTSMETAEGSSADFNTSFGSSINYVNSDNFEYASLRCSFGGMKVYFDNAEMPGGQAVIDLDVSFGGVELYIPRSWSILNRIQLSAAGIEEKGRSEAVGERVVTLNGKASFSGITIFYI